MPRKLKDQGEQGYYQLGDYALSVPFKDRMHYMAKTTGEFRPPKAGEWYLSGAQVIAYRARSDLSQPFHIAQAVRVKRTTVITITEEV